MNWNQGKIKWGREFLRKSYVIVLGVFFPQWSTVIKEVGFGGNHTNMTMVSIIDPADFAAMKMVTY